MRCKFALLGPASALTHFPPHFACPAFPQPAQDKYYGYEKKYDSYDKYGKYDDKYGKYEDKVRQG
jgi:hypothetical protein